MSTPTNVKNYYDDKPNAAQKYGAPRDGGKRKHRGTDFSHSTKSGTLVPALIDAKVTGHLNASSWNGFGNQIITEGKGPDGRTYRVSYAHGAKPQSASGKVSQGQYVSTEGTTGATTGPCMHLEVYDVAKKKFIDPMILVKLVLADKKPSGGGSSTGSSSIRDIQTKLNKLGHNLVVDGVKGPKTVAAIKSFQRKYGLTADGIWGPKTAAMYKRVTNPVRPTIRRGSTGSHVATLQKKLGVKADGVFGPLTEAAVKKYQKKQGLTADGIVGAKTWAKLGF